ncbi:programmed cell death protein 5 [Bombyx mandarina]|uniref:Programmed cell death protein 5-like protein n=2 Tax=Bombyx TaxID=7090 RepID=A0FDQ0_BOMMO|nr:programmed cell death protein 5-like protein [Bombyx mori]XP_012550382.1 programmed cell death protein 5-like protein isoform X1 [Bombyx mori]XP_012550383.1 programmed cell death protein 5-like protein isoform X1 [Bombyx mori]XP_028039003.1 programmed cell death protein 5 [Bombyx mandarina]XP_028039004.1 programmed cell death protein 5 [Bombyx mandarina]XP_028039006.1 programmed cell death protein 5 [Bombyx mandarina]ABJ97180.1 programmed cell death protein 5-like protein [Bombyx mori]
MDDPELDQIRQQRLAQLQAQQGGTGDPSNAKAQQEKMQAMEQAKHTILSQALSQDARARLNTIKLGRPEKAAMIENMICRMAQMGQIQCKITEPDLIQILESFNQQMPKSQSTVKFDRRRAALDSDDEDL